MRRSVLQVAARRDLADALYHLGFLAQAIENNDPVRMASYSQSVRAYISDINERAKKVIGVPP